jgi:uncharacterized membrane protein YeaQ/YmgE (transglycosylase-associated protein family)
MPPFGFDFDGSFPGSKARAVPAQPLLGLDGCCRSQNSISGRLAMGVLGWIVFGLVVGIVAKLVVPGRDPGGLFLTMVLGVVGALVGGYLGRLLGLYGPNDPVGFLLAVGGSILLLVLYRMVAGRPRPARM